MVDVVEGLGCFWRFYSVRKGIRIKKAEQMVWIWNSRRDVVVPTFSALAIFIAIALHCVVVGACYEY
jgi:hypothetical protein